MRFTTEEIDALNGIYEKYNELCDSFSNCSDCPMDYVVIDKLEHCFERGCLLADIGYALAKYK